MISIGWAARNGFEAVIKLLRDMDVDISVDNRLLVGGPLNSDLCIAYHNQLAWHAVY